MLTDDPIPPESEPAPHDEGPPSAPVTPAVGDRSAQEPDPGVSPESAAGALAGLDSSDQGWTLIAMIPYDGQEPPAGAHDAEASSIWAAVSGIWHPSLLAHARSLPRIESIDSPTPPGPRELRVIAGAAADRLPSGYRTQAEDAGALLLESAADRAELIRQVQGRMSVRESAAPVETQGMSDTAGDFLALGTARWMLRDLAIGMGHAEGLDREGLWREVSAGAHAWRLGDCQAATNRLRAAFEVLTQARERFYPVDAYLIDLCLLDPSLPAGVLADVLDAPIPVTLIAPASAIERQASVDRERLLALKQAIADGWADVAGGPYTEVELALMPLESIIWQFLRGNDVYRQHLDDRSVESFASRRFGLFVQLPQVLRRSGIRYALHMAFDGGKFPPCSETKRMWEGPEGSSLESLMRPPVAGDRPAQGWRLAWRLAATMRDDHIAALPIVRWPRPVAGWLSDLRRVAGYSPVLGRWTTLNDFFHLTDRPYENLRPDPDGYATPYLAQAVARGDTEPVSWLARHRRLRAAVDSARIVQAFASAIASSAGGPDAAPLVSADVPSGESIEERLETRRLAEAADGLGRAQAEWAAALAGLIGNAGRGAVGSSRRGYLVINPLGLPRRAAVLLPDASADLRPEGPLRAAQLTDEGVYAIVELPPFGFAWVPAETEASRPAAAGGALSARDRELRNETMAIEVDAATGGLRSIAGAREPSPRLAQQLVAHGLADASGRPVGSRMVGDRFEVDYAGPVLVQATARGRIVDPANDRALAGFEQRYRLWTGRPILEIRVTFDAVDASWIEESAHGDPWAAYLACRWAWPDSNAMLRRTLLLSPEMTESDRPETPDAVDITTRTQRTAILMGGLAYQRRQGPRMLDTLLIAGRETQRSFELGVVLDLEHPFQAAQDFVTPALVVPVDSGPPPAGATGWLARVDRTNVAVSRIEFVENAGDRGWGLVVHLLETAGLSARCGLRFFRNPTWARQVDLLGETIIDLCVDGDGLQVDLTPHELGRVEVAFG